MTRPAGKHICILASAHPPDDIRVTHRLGRSLVEGGFRVTWVGPEAPYRGTRYPIEFRYYPRRPGKLARIFRSRLLRETAQHVQDVDVYFAVEPDSAAVAVRLAKRTGAGAVFDIHEMFHTDMLGHWVPGLLRPLTSRLVRQSIAGTCSKCDLVVGVGTTRLEPYARSIRKGMIVRHCLPKGFADRTQAQPLTAGRSEVVVMHGKGTASHGTRAVLEAAKIARPRSGRPIKVIVFRLGYTVPRGFGTESLEQLVHDMAVGDLVDFRDAVGFDAMFPILEGCDMGVIAYQRSLGVHCMPNRIFEYMAMGLPVIAPEYSVELADIVKRYNCGVLVDTENPSCLGEALARLIERPDKARLYGDNGRRAFEESLNWETEAAPLLDWLSNFQRCPV